MADPLHRLWPFLEFNDLNSAIRSDYLGPPAQSCSRGVAPFANLEFDSIITFHEKSATAPNTIVPFKTPLSD